VGAAMKSMKGSEPFRSIEGGGGCSHLPILGAQNHFEVRRALTGAAN
jgi:hypothetical protein